MMTASWKSPHSDRHSVGQDEVHVWLVDLDATPADSHHGSAYLSRSERDRYLRFRFERDRRRFRFSKIALRFILSRYTRTEPGCHKFIYSSRGKPSLSGNSTGSLPTFSLSRSYELAMIAVSFHRAVGIDHERVDEHVDVEAISGRFFSQGEFQEILKLPSSVRREGFFRFWVRKEAYLKARGLGIGGEGFLKPLGTVDQNEWSIQTVETDEPWIAAVAAEGCDWKVKLRWWEWD